MAVVRAIGILQSALNFQVEFLISKLVGSVIVSKSDTGRFVFNCFINNVIACLPISNACCETVVRGGSNKSGSLKLLKPVNAISPGILRPLLRNNEKQPMVIRSEAVVIA